MPTYLSPDVYVEELPSQNRPIEGVGTSTGAFVGFAEKGPIGEARLIGSRSDFYRTFGGPVTGCFLPHAVDLFFINGGTRCYVVRTSAHDGVGDPIASASSATLTDAASNPALTIKAATPGTWGDRIGVAITHVSSSASQFNLEVFLGGESVETREAVELSTIEASINSGAEASSYIRVTQGSGSPGRPEVTGGGYVNLTGGDNGSAAGVVAGDFTGVHGLEAFDPIDDVNIVAIPEVASREVMQAGLSYCEGRGDCFFVAHAGELDDTAAEALSYKQASGAEYPAQAPFNSSFGALYVPWIEVSNPAIAGRRLILPPDGAVAGRYSATDVRRGVHKAPAGIDDGRLRGVLRLSRAMSQAEIQALNPNHVNVIRRIEGVGSTIWGARTLSSDPSLRYVSVRRFLLFIEESIAEATQWVVFEPNTPSLWRQLERVVRGFLRVQWRNGALFGVSEEEAFFVKCDEETNPLESRRAGKVVTEIGVAIVKPAEFVIFRIQQSPGGFDIEE